MESSNTERDRIWLLCRDLMLVAAQDGTIVATNPSWATVLGWSEAELRSMTFLGLMHPDDLQKATDGVAQLADGVPSIRLDGRWRHKDGSYQRLDWTVVPEGKHLYAIGRDTKPLSEGILDSGQSEAMRYREQQIDAMGRFGAVISHDFNNVLQGISGLMELARRLIKVNRLEEAERFIENAIDSAKRAATLTDRIHAFSNRSPIELKPVEMNNVIRAMESILDGAITPQISMRVVLSPALWTTLCDSNQFEKALLHLIRNARDAMPAGGALVIETSNQRLTDSRPAFPHAIAPGEYVCIAVTDSGTGMSQASIQKVFDPLFTTKKSGLSAGFGLCMVYNFVRQSRGYVEISSEIEAGTVVKLYLPRYDPPRQESKQPGLL